MLLRLLCLALLVSAASARLSLEPISAFEAQGLEELTPRYGTAYPGYGGFGNTGLNSIGLQQPWMQQQQLGMGMQGEAEELQQPMLGAGLQQQWSQANLASTFGNVGGNGASFGLGAQQLLQPMLGGFGGLSNQWALGAGSLGAPLAGGSKKGQTTVAAPIYAESVIVPRVITQPILRPHMVTQPIIQRQLIQQPIVETRQVIQPVIRRIITQPIIRPQILESTTIQPQLKTETIVQPHLVQQTVVTPQVQNLAMENAPIQEAAVTQMGQTQVMPTMSKKGAGAMGGYGAF